MTISSRARHFSLLFSRCLFLQLVLAVKQATAQPGCVCATDGIVGSSEMDFLASIDLGSADTCRYYSDSTDNRADNWFSQLGFDPAWKNPTFAYRYCQVTEPITQVVGEVCDAEHDASPSSTSNLVGMAGDYENAGSNCTAMKFKPLAETVNIRLFGDSYEDDSDRRQQEDYPGGCFVSYTESGRIDPCHTSLYFATDKIKPHAAIAYVNAGTVCIHHRPISCHHYCFWYDRVCRLAQSCDVQCYDLTTIDPSTASENLMTIPLQYHVRPEDEAEQPLVWLEFYFTQANEPMTTTITSPGAPSPSLDRPNPTTATTNAPAANPAETTPSRSSDKLSLHVLPSALAFVVPAAIFQLVL